MHLIILTVVIKLGEHVGSFIHYYQGFKQDWFELFQ